MIESKATRGEITTGVFRQAGRECEIVTSAWDGNYRPWRAIVYVDGKRVGVTGFCKTQAAANRAAEAILTKATERMNEKEVADRLVRRLAGVIANREMLVRYKGRLTLNNAEEAAAWQEARIVELMGDPAVDEIVKTIGSQVCLEAMERFDIARENVGEVIAWMEIRFDALIAAGEVTA